ncbi:MAG: FAD-dependent oxidoreductase [Acetobacteraceae bacterium]|nr:FAD-dependent oxidoreductase [Acetobacteraceae bacterium]
MSGGHALVLGAGVVGAAGALALRRDGWRVTLLDRGAPGEGCSLGNAGNLGVASVVPQATPAQIRAIPRLLREADGPLVARWPYVLRELPWFVRFVANGRSGKMEANARALAGLMERVPESWDALAAEAGAADLFARAGLLHVWRGEAAMRGAAWAYDLRRRLGARVEEMDADAARAREPALQGEVAGARLLPDVPTVTDPLELTRRLVSRFEALGGVVERVEAAEVVREGGRARGVRAVGGGLLDADVVVLAAGAWSARLARPHGARVPVAAERGYHVMVSGANARVVQPLMLVEARVMASPMRGGLRLTTMAEFAEPDAPPDHDRAARVLDGASVSLPGVLGKVESRWMGARPSTPDSLPVIGRAPRARNLLLAYGHGHLGLTMASVTAEAVADLAADRPPRLDLAACSASRWAA